MKEQLISFETVKLAKERGFDWKVYWYCSYKRKVPTNDQTFYPDENGELKNYNDDKNNFYEKFSLPTQSLLQKWLRDKYGIHILIIPTITTYWTFKTVNVISDKALEEPPYKNVSGEDFQIYEDALERALIESLKLIKE